MQCPWTLFCTLALQALCVLPCGAADWKLVWCDEFNQAGAPDTTKWTYEEGLVRNQEAQYYTRERSENARVEGGMLVIEGRKEAFPAAPGKPAALYTSASLTTEGKASWTYGRVEVRARQPQGKGVWPAIWTLGDNIHSVSWPKCGEIDIMEFVGHSPQLIHGTVHYGTSGNPASNGSTIAIANPSEGFHVYAVEWWPDRIDFFFDDKKYYSFLSDKAGAGTDNPFRKPHYLILNLALGGTWGGPIDDSILPQKFLIDYVRVYQQQP